MFAATADLSKAVDLFEQQKLHNARDKMEKVLMSQLRKCVVEEQLNNLDEVLAEPS